jgi:hypothetical protein
MIVKKVKYLEDQKPSISNTTQQKERELEQIDDKEIDILVLRELLSDFTGKYHTFNKEQKRRLNHLIFAAITSYLNVENIGRVGDSNPGNGMQKRTWNQLKK